MALHMPVLARPLLILRRPMDNQQNIATAQGRADAREATGFVLQKWEFQAETAVQDAGGRCERHARCPKPRAGWRPKSAGVGAATRDASDAARLAPAGFGDNASKASPAAALLCPAPA